MMDPTRQQIVDDAIHDAHFAGGEIVTNEVAARIVSSLNASTVHHPWLADYLADLTIKGAAKVYSDWRRRYTIPATTKKGTALELPAYAGHKARDDEGQVVYTQMRLLDMSLPQLVEHRGRMVKTRDTMSVQVRLLSDLIEAMEADASLLTAGDALARLEAA